MFGKHKISNVEWAMVISTLFLTDATQLVLDFLLIGLTINPIIDIYVGMSFAFYLTLRGQNLTDAKRLVGFLGAGAGDAISDGALPLWGLDGIYSFFLAKADEKIGELKSGLGNVREPATPETTKKAA